MQREKHMCRVNIQREKDATVPIQFFRFHYKLFMQIFAYLKYQKWVSENASWSEFTWSENQEYWVYFSMKITIISISIERMSLFWKFVIFRSKISFELIWIMENFLNNVSIYYD